MSKEDIQRLRVLIAYYEDAMNIKFDPRHNFIEFKQGADTETDDITDFIKSLDNETT